MLKNKIPDVSNSAPPSLVGNLGGSGKKYFNFFQNPEFASDDHFKTLDEDCRNFCCPGSEILSSKFSTFKMINFL